MYTLLTVSPPLRGGGVDGFLCSTKGGASLSRVRLICDLFDRCISRMRLIQNMFVLNQIQYPSWDVDKSNGNHACDLHSNWGGGGRGHSRRRQRTDKSNGKLNGNTRFKSNGSVR